MYAIVREILLYTFFVLVTFSISYSLREEVGFWQTNGLERLFNLPTKETGQFAKDQFSGVRLEIYVLCSLKNIFSKNVLSKPFN